MRPTHCIGLIAVLFAILVSHAGLANQGRSVPLVARTRVDVSKLGPQVGEPVPDFTLNDQHGKPWTLESVMGPKGAMIVFYRSADW